jgi:hypothetical protein
MLEGARPSLALPIKENDHFYKILQKKNSKSYTMGPIKPRYLRTKTGDASERPNNPQIN